MEPSTSSSAPHSNADPSMGAILGGMLRPGLPHIRDYPAAIVVFLVALPLCLGIALASGAPLSSGLVAGIIGGVVVGFLSESHVMVSGPAAGLTAVMISAIAELGSFAAVLPAIVVAGALQIVLGLWRAGMVAFFVPSAVIKGMLSAIGIILVLKQLPHLIGHDTDAFGDESFIQPDQDNTFSALIHAIGDFQAGSLIISLLSLVILIGWPRIKLKAFRLIPAPLLVVLIGAGLALAFEKFFPAFAIGANHFVQLPTPENVSGWASELALPDWSALQRPATWLVGVTLGLVASIESLLSLEASDRIDPYRRVTSPDRELLAQGVGNILSGWFGGLPITGVIVRTSANVDAGARTRYSGILHGLLLLAAILVIPVLLNRIPLASLAAILLLVGYNLARPQLVKAAWMVGTAYFTPFVVTVIAILLTDLLKGVLIGTGVSVFFILRETMRAPGLVPVSMHGAVLQRYALPDQLTFLHKGTVQRTLEGLEDGARVELDGSNCRFIDYDVLRLIHGFKRTALSKGVDYRLVAIPPLPGEELPEH